MPFVPVSLIEGNTGQKFDAQVLIGAQPGAIISFAELSGVATSVPNTGADTKIDLSVAGPSVGSDITPRPATDDFLINTAGLYCIQFSGSWAAGSAIATERGNNIFVNGAALSSFAITLAPVGNQTATYGLTFWAILAAGAVVHLNGTNDDAVGALNCFGGMQIAGPFS